MKHLFTGLLVLFCVGAVVAVSRSAGPSAPPGSRHLSRAVFTDKVKGGWAGQMIGVSYGEPTEFRAMGHINDAPLSWSPERVKEAIRQDDLYVEMTFAEVMDRVGLDATSRQYGEMFKGSQYRLWHANAGARRLLARGIEPPMSGDPKYNAHADDIDFQIESDFIGMMTPGLPQAANLYADRVGRVMNYGDGLYGGMFFSGMYAAAFFETDPRRVVEIGLQSIPADSAYARLISDVLVWSRENPGPDDWRKVWQMIADKWDRDDLCPDGAFSKFNIDAKLNGAYVVLGLLYGRSDFGRTIEIATRPGQDSDCNPSSAAGILGVMLGYDRIPENWKGGIPAIADTKFEFTSYSFNSIVASTIARAEKVVTAAGGLVTPAGFDVPPQSPKAPALEQWNAGVPVARVALDEAAWTLGKGWVADTVQNDAAPFPKKVRRSTAAGDEATFAFDGTGVVITGAYSQGGGRADVWLDGQRSDLVLDAWIPERTFDTDYWHVTGLADGHHVVRIVTRADADARSTGHLIELEQAVVYRAATR